MSKKAWLISVVLGLGALTSVALSAPNNQTQPASAIQSTQTQTVHTVSQAQPATYTNNSNYGSAATAQPSTDSHLSNDNYYTNSVGNSVHAPAYSNGGIPAGASARCGDGTYSFSQSHRGTCSHHGGVSSWL